MILGSLYSSHRSHAFSVPTSIPAFTVYDDDRCVSGADCLFHLAYEVEIARSVKKVDLDLSSAPSYSIGTIVVEIENCLLISSLS